MNRTAGLPGLRRLRRAADLTQEQLAEKVGVRRETISGVEVGLVDASMKLARNVAEALGCETADLLRPEPAQGEVA